MTGSSRDRSVTDEALNAYVDGALSSGEAAYIARCSAADPRIAMRIAVLHQLKAGVAGLTDDMIVIDPIPKIFAPRPQRRLRGGLAALVAASVLGVSVLWVGDQRDGETIVTAGDPISGLIAQHDAWSGAAGAGGATPSTTEWLTGLMQATGLVLAHQASTVAADGTATQHLAFVGPNGCKLSLFDGPPLGEATTQLDLSITGALLTARWTDGGRGYALVARSMDRSRFVAIAAAVHDASRSRGAVDVQALADLRWARQPCIG